MLEVSSKSSGQVRASCIKLDCGIWTSLIQSNITDSIADLSNIAFDPNYALFRVTEGTYIIILSSFFTAS